MHASPACCQHAPEAGNPDGALPTWAQVDAFRAHWEYQTEEQRTQEVVNLLMADFMGMQ